MSMMPLISIVLPTFNGGEFIVKAIESCLKQTYKNFELIIVNDCSTDNTRNIVEEYCKHDTRIRVINNEVNCKLPKSLNIGFDSARGDYLTWTSDDNYFAPQALETLLGELERNVDTDIIYSSYSFVDEKDNVLEYYGGAPENLLFSCIIGACFLYRRNVHVELKGYALDKFRMEDMDFWLRAAAKFRFQFIDDKSLYFYRKHKNSLTSHIYSNQAVLAEYRQNYFASFKHFFNNFLEANFSDEDLEIHVKIFFEDILSKKKFDFSLSDEVLLCLHHLEKLSNLDWNKVSFNRERVQDLVTKKKDRIISIVINDLIFHNKQLIQQNPALAAHIDKPISWYYREYEVLPRWYKRIGHLIKMLQGNKPIPFFSSQKS
ncbi:hypothetical protein GCM10027443_01270 [Pontibacter brevis]